MMNVLPYGKITCPIPACTFESTIFQLSRLGGIFALAVSFGFAAKESTTLWQSVWKHLLLRTLSP